VTSEGAPDINFNHAEWSDGKRRGLSVVQTAEDGRASSVVEDELGRAIKSSTLGFGGAWMVSSVDYDAFGNVEEVSRPGSPIPSSHRSQYFYDRLGHATLFVSPDGEKTTFEHEMFATRSVDPAGHRAYVLRDKDDRVKESGHTVNGDEYGEVSFKYGAFDQVDKITDAKKNVTSMTYDELGRRTSITDPDSGTSKFQYNGFGELTAEVDALGGATKYEYDALGRVTAVHSPDGESTFVWDAGTGAVGRLTKATSQDGVVTENTYDSFGRPRETRRTVGGETYAVTRSYDGYGRLKNLFYPVVAGRSRFTVQYGYNAAGYMETVRDMTDCPPAAEGPTTEFSKKFADLPPITRGQTKIHTSKKDGRPGGGTTLAKVPDKPPAASPKCDPRLLWRVKARNADLALAKGVFGNGVESSRAYDEKTGRITGVFTNGEGVWLSYGYNKDGLLDSRVDEHTGRKETFGYDDLHRLTTWKLYGVKLDDKKAEPAGPTSYAYDELGNLLSITKGGKTEFEGKYDTPGKPHALRWSSTEGDFHYDARGRQMSGGGRDSVAYTSYDLPREIKTPAGITTFAYDAAGSRAAQIPRRGDRLRRGAVREARPPLGGASRLQRRRRLRPGRASPLRQQPGRREVALLRHRPARKHDPRPGPGGQGLRAPPLRAVRGARGRQRQPRQ
jgi:YD repeat-containing protein